MNSKEKRKGILVTGSHRSGTTWVGRMIASSRSVVYIHEPFHLNHDLGICSAKFKHWFAYISEENQSEYEQKLKQTTEFHYNLKKKMQSAETHREKARGIFQYLRFLCLRNLNRRPLIKDPHAVFSSHWLSERLQLQTIVMVRHPAAFAGSLKMVKWRHPFSHFLQQRQLMSDHLYPFEDEIRFFARKDRNIVDQAALLWKMIYYTVHKFSESHPDWIILRHEDLSRDPIEGFKRIYNNLGLHFARSTEDAVRAHSSVKQNAKHDHLKIHRIVKRDSHSNIAEWKNRLTTIEIKRVKKMVDDISSQYYDDDDWIA